MAVGSPGTPISLGDSVDTTSLTGEKLEQIVNVFAVVSLIDLLCGSWVHLLLAQVFGDIVSRSGSSSSEGHIDALPVAECTNEG